MNPMSRLLRLISGVSALCLLAMTASAAPTQLKQVQVSQKDESSQVDFLFDNKITPAQIKTEYLNDIIQLVITDVSIYPAKIAAVDSESLTKVFAYQFSPKVVRCRLSVKGKAEDYKDQFELQTNGKVVTIKLRSGKGAVTQAKAAPVAPKQEVSDPELLKKISEEPIRVAQAAPVAAPGETSAKGQNKKNEEKAEEKKVESASTRESSIIGSSTTPIFRSLGKLALFFGFFGILALLAKKFFSQGLQNALRFNQATSQRPARTGLMGMISQFATSKLSGRGKLIEVIATHHLGPKRSIHVVRVGEKTLVIGSTAENINLISELDGEGETSGLIQEYGSALTTARAAATTTASAKTAPAPAQGSGANAINAMGGKLPRPAFPHDLAGPDFSQVIREANGQHGAVTNVAHSKIKAYVEPAMNTATTTASAGETNPAYQALQNSIRGQIKSKLEGLKPL